jgi:para-nitrobenzyl esterase
MIPLVIAVAASATALHAQSSREAAGDTSVASGLVVDVTGGKVRGASLAGGAAAFLGIPYARPPVGALRWREPAPVERWTGIRDAKAYGAPCAQNPYFNPAFKETAREDCLYLNVVTPEIRPKGGGRPVMVWIPGGGNFAGASGERTNGEQLMRHDVVVVSLNYRLGLFGFFSHPDLTRESPHHASGNQGILDQIAALRWVHANIARFGGDPSNVTIFGESAGSVNVSVLMTSPLSRGLFRRVIGQSGAVIVAGDPLSLKDAESRGVSLAEMWGVGAKPSIEALRALPMAAILAAEPNFLDKPQPNLGVTIDGYVFPVRPSMVFAQGHQHPVAMLLGNLWHEWVPGVQPPANLREAIESSYPSDVATRAVSLYMESGTDSLYGTPAEQWVEDIGFRCSAIAQLIWHAAAKHVAYEYQVEHLPAARRRGNVHAQDVAYVFGRLDGNDYEAFDRAMSDVIQKYWTNFAKTGDPNGPGVPSWPAFDPTSRPYLAFTEDGAVARNGLRRPFCDLFLDAARP